MTRASPTRRLALIVPLLALGCSAEPTVVPAAQLEPQLAFAGAATEVGLQLGDAELAGVGTPLHGAATMGPTGALLYTPEPGYLGRDSVEYRVRPRGGGAVETRMLRVYVMPGPYAVVPLSAGGGFIPHAMNDARVVAGALVTGGVTTPAMWNDGAATLLGRTGLDSGSALWITRTGALSGVGRRGSSVVGAVWRTPSSAAEITEARQGIGAVMIDGTGTVVVDSLATSWLMAVNARTHRLVRDQQAMYPMAIVYEGTANIGMEQVRNFPEDINDSVDVVGRRHVGTEFAAPYLWNPRAGVLRDLREDYAGALHQPLRISNSRVIAGVTSDGAPGGAAPALFVNGAWWPLTNLLREQPGAWVIEEIVDMNDRHDLVAYARHRDGGRVPVLLTAPE